MTVLGNLILALSNVKKMPKTDAITKAKSLLIKVGLTDKDWRLSKPIVWRPTAACCYCQSTNDGSESHFIW